MFTFRGFHNILLELCNMGSTGEARRQHYPKVIPMRFRKFSFFSPTRMKKKTNQSENTPCISDPFSLSKCLKKQMFVSSKFVHAHTNSHCTQRTHTAHATNCFGHALRGTRNLPIGHHNHYRCCVFWFGELVVHCNFRNCRWSTTTATTTPSVSHGHQNERMESLLCSIKDCLAPDGAEHWYYTVVLTFGLACPCVASPREALWRQHISQVFASFAKKNNNFRQMWEPDLAPPARVHFQTDHFCFFMENKHFFSRSCSRASLALTCTCTTQSMPCRASASLEHEKVGASPAGHESCRYGTPTPILRATSQIQALPCSIKVSRRNEATQAAVYQRLHAWSTLEIWRRSSKQIRACWLVTELSLDVLHGCSRPLLAGLGCVLWLPAFSLVPFLRLPRSPWLRASLLHLWL